MKRTILVLPLYQCLLLLLCIFIVGTVLTSLLSWLLARVLAGNIAASIRISTMMQEVLSFIVPAVATACIITRRPAVLLAIRKVRGTWTIPLAIAALVLSIPAQEVIINWNNSITMPESIDGFCRELEESSAAAMKLILADTSVAALIVNVLIVGVAAGFAEEFLFRGCFQRLLTAGGMGHHAAIWIVAFIFSAMHLQIFGFVPRLLLGAFFGYLLWWSGSIWVPVCAHALNNSVYVVTAWLELRSNPDALADPQQMEFAWPAVVASVIMTALALTFLYRYTAALSKHGGCDAE